jgi:molecular chaperone GrpE (heat shock protein)
LFTSVSETDEHRFALEGSLRRAKIGTELVLVKSETRRQQTETKVVAATEELDEAEKELDELNDTFSRVAAELKLRCDEVEKLRAESLDS